MYLLSKTFLVSLCLSLFLSLLLSAAALSKPSPSQGRAGVLPVHTKPDPRVKQQASLSLPLSLSHTLTLTYIVSSQLIDPCARAASQWKVEVGCTRANYMTDADENLMLILSLYFFFLCLSLPPFLPSLHRSGAWV